MTATLVAIDTAAEQTENKREQRLRHAWYDTYRDLNDVLRAKEATTFEKLQELFDSYWHAAHRYSDFNLGRARKAEKILRRVLDTATMDPKVRELAISGIPGGKRGCRRDSTLLTEHEQKLVADYRAMAAADRQAARTIFDRFAAAAKGRTDA